MTATRKKHQKKKKAVQRQQAAASTSVPRGELDMSALQPLLGFHLRRAMSMLIRSFNENVLDGQIRPGLASLLRLVATNHGASQVELSRALQVDKATLVALIDTAEAEGWLKRQRSTLDRRKHEVILTADGQEIVDELARQTALNERRFLSKFTPEERDRLIEYLERIYREDR